MKAKRYNFRNTAWRGDRVFVENGKAIEPQDSLT